MELQDFLELLKNEFDFNTDGIDMNTTFEEINFDELDMIDLVMAVEDLYSIEVTDDILKSIVTIGDFVNFIDSNIQ